LTGPHVFLTVFHSNIPSMSVSSVVIVQASDLYVSMGHSGIHSEIKRKIIYIIIKANYHK
jgi:hypothetical protein